MDSWRTVWRNGFVPGFSNDELSTLRHALLDDDPRLLQGATTQPEPIQSHLDWSAEAACAITFGAWQAAGLETVAELDEYFTRSCFEADMRLGEPAACRWFLNWHDDAPRAELRRELLAEVDRELCRRGADDDAELWTEEEHCGAFAAVAA